MSIFLLAIDIDGTLLGSRGQLLPENRVAVHDALKAGIEVVLVTGRCYHHAKPVAAVLSKTLVIIANNGALVKTVDGRTLEKVLLNRKLAREIILSTRQIKRGAALIFDRVQPSQYLFENVDWNHPNRKRYYDRNRRYMEEASPLEDALIEDPLQLAFSGTLSEMRRLAEFLSGLELSEQISITRTEYDYRNFSLLDITACDCSKGSTLEAWATARGFDREQVMAVGDNLNDREMLEFAGWPVVMGNAVPVLKTLGWRITGNHDEGGLAEAIRSIALI